MGSLQWKSPLLQYVSLSPEEQRAIQARRRNVIDKFQASSFKEVFTLATPFACKLRWFAGDQPCHGHHDGVLSISKLGTKNHIIAKLSKSSPWEVTYEVWARCLYTEQTLFERSLTFRDLCLSSESGKSLQSPFDRAFWDASNAEHNLTILVKWYYLASHVVDVTDGNSAAFAKALKLTVQSYLLDVPRELRSRAAGVDQTVVQRKLQEGQKLPDPKDAVNRSEEDSSKDDNDSAASHPSEEDDRDQCASFSSIAGLQTQKAGPPSHEVLQAGNDIGFPNIDDLVDSSHRGDTPLQPADQERSRAAGHTFPGALKMVGKESFAEPFQFDDASMSDNEETLDDKVALFVRPVADGLDPVQIVRQFPEVEDSYAHTLDVVRSPTVEAAAGSSEHAATILRGSSDLRNHIAGRDLKNRVEAVLERCGLLAYSRSVLQGVGVIDLVARQRQEGYLPQVLGLVVKETTTRVYALLRNNKVDNCLQSSAQANKGKSLERLQEIELFAREDCHSDLKLVQGISFPKKYRRVLRRPFSLTGWHVDDDLPQKLQREVHEGGNRLRLLCQYIFIVIGQIRRV